MSEQPANAHSDIAPSLEDARYWFDQYLQAAGWEARLIDDIRNLRRRRTQPGTEAGDGREQLSD